ncbi:MAG: CotH kinase family protein, partial [Myxococcota bacterium]
MSLLLVLLGCGPSPDPVLREGPAPPVYAGPRESLGDAPVTWDVPADVGLLLIEPSAPIVDEERVEARLVVVGRPDAGGGKAAPSLVTRAAIEARGKSSSTFPKRSYNLELQDDDGDDLAARLLGLPAEADWVLHGPYTDKTALRNAFTYALARRMGPYAPRTAFTEVRINGAYAGLYTLVEKPEIDPVRVDLPEPTDDDGVVTGGFLFKIEGGTDGGAGWRSERGTIYELHDPGPDEITDAQLDLLRTVVDKFEAGLRAGADPDRHIDIASFVDFVIVQELSRNVDGYRRSTFLQAVPTDEGYRLRAGPVWDFDIAWGNADFCDGWNPEGLVWDAADVCEDWVQIPSWWHALLRDERFLVALRCRWEELRGGVLADEALGLGPLERFLSD